MELALKLWLAIVHDAQSILLTTLILLIIAMAFFLHTTIRRNREYTDHRLEECEDSHIQADTIRIREGENFSRALHLLSEQKGMFNSVREDDEDSSHAKERKLKAEDFDARLNEIMDAAERNNRLIEANKAATIARRDKYRAARKQKTKWNMTFGQAA